MTALNALPVDFGGDLVESATAMFSPCRRYRYVLTRRWHVTDPWLAFIMLNPSTADAFKVDPTITRCRSRARRLGAGGLIVLNLFAYRATAPKDMREQDDPVGPDNDMVIAEYVRNVPTVVVAWGSDIIVKRTGRDRQVLRLLASANSGAYRIGAATAGGHPGHPLYLPSDSTLQAHRPLL